jgi:hypothetical protein
MTANVEITENNVMFLIGAGCSAEAGVKIANAMVNDVERYVQEQDEWGRYRDLYHYLKSAILYAEGIFGNFSDKLNIEKLLIVLSELAKKEQNIAYPFIGNWNMRLMEVAGENLIHIKEFRKLIYRQLHEWVNIKQYNDAQYYRGFANFQTEIGYPIRIFSFNYDLCVEEVLRAVNIELGFDPKTARWLYSNFEPNSNKDIGIYLYKLHGSIDWQRDEDAGNVVRRLPHPTTTPDVIFGTDAKLTSIDPYLYYVFEFRKYSLLDECKLIIVIGYSFSDEYMNRLLAQALNASASRKLLIVDPYPEGLKRRMTTEYRAAECQIEVVASKASEFLNERLRKAEIAK